MRKEDDEDGISPLLSLKRGGAIPSVVGCH